jgi:hypothetical protein
MGVSSRGCFPKLLIHWDKLISACLLDDCSGRSMTIGAAWLTLGSKWEEEGAGTTLPFPFTLLEDSSLSGSR